MAARVVLVPGIENLITIQPEFLAAMETAASGIAEYAKSIAPVSPPGEETPGAYRESIEGHAEVEDGLGIGVVSAAGDPPEQAIYLEFGTSDTPTFATLRRAGEAFRI